MHQEDSYRIAQKRVAKKRAFFRHFSVFLVTGGFFFLLNILTDPRDMWFFFPMLPWGMGLAFHYLAAFGIPGQREDWEERELEKEIRRLESRGHKVQRPLSYEQEEELELRDLTPRERRALEKKWRDEDFV